VSVERPPGRELLIGLVAIAAAARCSTEMARRLIEAGELPVHRVGAPLAAICATPSAVRHWRAGRLKLRGASAS